MVQAASGMASRGFFGPDYDVRQIGEVVRRIRNAGISRGRTPPVSQLVMEAVIRVGLGETDVDTSGITPPDVFTTQGVLTGYIAAHLGWTEARVVQRIIQAEKIAVAGGFSPPLAAG